MIKYIILISLFILLEVNIIFEFCISKNKIFIGSFDGDLKVFTYPELSPVNTGFHVCFSDTSSLNLARFGYISGNEISLSIVHLALLIVFISYMHTYKRSGNREQPPGP